MVVSSCPRELLTENMPIIERAVAFAARRFRLDSSDADELRAIVHFKLVENDYAIVRAYEQRSRFSTYISVVIQRIALDFRTRAWGKWHTSAEAKRQGPLAVDLERLLLRDGRSLEEAETLLAARHGGGVTLQSLQALRDRLPQRTPRHREVSLEPAETVAVVCPETVEESAVSYDRRRASQRVSQTVAAVLAELSDQDRVILRLRFEGNMTVAQIARTLHLEQRFLYRRIDQRLQQIRAELLRRGVARDDVLELIGHDEAHLAFDIEKTDRRPSKPDDETSSGCDDFGCLH